MNGALWLLIGLQLRGWLRYLFRSLHTLKGAILALVGLAVFVPWVAMIVLMPRQRGSWLGHDFREAGPALLLLYCLLNVVFSTGERAVYFPPAEVNLLFPGPFGRRELLVYKIVSTLILSLPTALFMTLMLHQTSAWLAASFVGMALIVLFMQLFSMTINLLAVSVGAHLYTSGRKWVAFLALVLGVALLLHVGGPPSQWQPRELMDKLLAAPAWKIASWPLRSFFEAATAERWPDLAGSAALGLLVNLALVGVIFALDAQYLEASAAASARIYTRIQRIRRGGMGSGEGLRRGAMARLRMPMLPWLGGVGPIAWRQLTTALRAADRLLLLFIILGAALAAPTLATLREDQENVFFAIAAIGFWLTLFLTTMLPFDFRGDIDRLALLKTLPLPAWRLAVGQLLAPVLLMTALQGIGLVVAAWASPPNEWLMPVCLACAAFLPPINFLLFALDNLLFLLFPTRLMAATPGDFQALGRNVLFVAAKAIVLGIVVGMALVVGGLVYWACVYLACGRSWLWAGLAAWPVVVLSAAALVPLVAWAFTIFDVGRDTPA
jgi:hypothetical protein